jgi:hypothetical protein
MTRHLTDDEMILLHYGELKDAASAERHLSSCDQCRSGLEALANSLAPLAQLEVPERGPEYGAQVWERIAQRMEPRAGSASRASRSLLMHRSAWAIAAAMIVMLAAGFMAGHFIWKPQPVAPVAEAVPGPDGRERILKAAVEDHLEKSQRMLVDLANATGTSAPFDVTRSRQRAEELLSDNRLYRQTAGQRGDAAAAEVLDDLERSLLEIAHGPAELTAAQLAELQARLERQGVILKIRLYGTGQRQQERAGAKDPAAQRT